MCLGAVLHVYVLYCFNPNLSALPCVSISKGKEEKPLLYSPLLLASEVYMHETNQAYIYVDAFI